VWNASEPTTQVMTARRMRRSHRAGPALFAVIAIVLAACSSTPAAPSATSAPAASVPAASAPEASAPEASAPAASAAGNADVVCPDGAPTRGNGKKQFGFAIGLQELPIIQALEKRMTQQATRCGWEVLYDTGTGANIQSMIPSVEAWITAGVPSITVAPFEPKAWEALAKRAVDKGQIWISYNQSTDTRYGTFGFGPCLAAKLMAQTLIPYIKASDPKAEIFISTNVANPSVACKWDGLKKDLEDATDATVLPFQDANNEPDGLKVMTSVLQAHPNVSIGIGTNDDVARGIARAFLAAGKDPATTYVAGFDGSEENLKQIKAGGGFIKLSAAIDLIDLADLVVEKNMELALSDATSPPADPPAYDVPVFALVNGSPQLDIILGDFALLQ
jgi:ABC-type sugar transport system substrate-binding protein